MREIYGTILIVINCPSDFAQNAGRFVERGQRWLIVCAAKVDAAAGNKSLPKRFPVSVFPEAHDGIHRRSSGPLKILLGHQSASFPHLEGTRPMKAIILSEGFAGQASGLAWG